MGQDGGTDAVVGSEDAVNGVVGVVEWVEAGGWKVRRQVRREKLVG